MAKPNKQLIQEKIDVVLRCLMRLRNKCPESLTQLQQDLDAQDILTINLERATQACVDIAAHLIAYSSFPAPSTMAGSFIVLRQAGVLSHAVADRMQKAVGLRNLLVHEYQKIDWSILWIVVTKHLVDFENFIHEIDHHI